MTLCTRNINGLLACGLEQERKLKRFVNYVGHWLAFGAVGDNARTVGLARSTEGQKGRRPVTPRFDTEVKGEVTRER